MAANTQAPKLEVQGRDFQVRLGERTYLSDEVLRKVPPTLREEILKTAEVGAESLRNFAEAQEVFIPNTLSDTKARLAILLADHDVEVLPQTESYETAAIDNARLLGASRRGDAVSMVSDLGSGLRNGMSATSSKVADLARPILGPAAGAANIEIGISMVGSGVATAQTALNSTGKAEGALTTLVGGSLGVAGLAMMLVFGPLLIANPIALAGVIAGVVLFVVLSQAMSGKLSKAQALFALGLVVLAFVAVATGIGLPLLMASATLMYGTVAVRAGREFYKQREILNGMMELANAGCDDSDKARAIYMFLKSQATTQADLDELAAHLGRSCHVLERPMLSLSPADIIRVQELVKHMSAKASGEMARQINLIALSVIGMLGVWLAAPVLAASFSFAANIMWVFNDQREASQLVSAVGRKLFEPTNNWAPLPKSE